MPATFTKYNLSYWEKDIFLKAFDVVIVGSGIVGLSAALRLKEQQPNLEVLVVERGALPIGASTRNAGFACFGSPSELIADIEQNGQQAMLDLIAMRWTGLEQLRKRVGDQGLQFKNWGGYELFLEGDEAIFEKCVDALPELNAQIGPLIGFKEPFELVDERKTHLGLGSGVQHLIFNRTEGQLHPGAMVSALRKLAQKIGVQILNGVEIEAIYKLSEGVELVTSLGWKLKSHYAILATNGFIRQFLPDLEVKPARNQVMITKAIDNFQLKGCFHYKEGYYYFRNIHGRLLLGGARNVAPEEETTTTFGTSDLIKNTLHQFAKTVILPSKEFEIAQWWSGILGVGTMKEPIIRKIKDNIVVAVRLGGMGVAIGTHVGDQAADLVLGKG